jgi:anti-anti-sigma factor
MSNLNISYSDYGEAGNITIISVEGEINLYNAKEIKDRVDELIRQERYKIILDFEKVPFVDSSGLGLLFKLTTTLKKYPGGGVCIYKLRPNIIKILKLTGTTENLKIYEDLRFAEDALK